MRQTSESRNSPGEKIVKDIKRATRKQYSSEEKIRIVLDGLRGEDSIAELCRREGHLTGHLLQMVEGLHGSGEEDGWLAIQPVPRTPTRSRICAAKRAI